jgi:two-component system CheB/CheR fusion protein
MGPRFVFRQDCRRNVIFGRHDVTKDAPMSRIDLLVCRNVLMYFVRDTRRRVLSRFHHALGGSGFLFLGKAETIFAHADLFTASNPRHRIFRRAYTAPGRGQLLSMTSVAATVDAVNRKGQPFRCRVTVSGLENSTDESKLVVLLDPLPDVPTP